ncbi:uncharacterized protein (DUF58 family) [Kibdelosporangium banguiense]|uniref:Uncharacterized protein (DUF58 family) n=1 Tax=Kibdelosporangium banguiense TaxID=1365924 RepID=A0ABS4TYQ1_9PSEU|nr:DUF58 domain-containing protein [Kibdelosporangium banguiense]MBP2329530.1 uncharacterized protein (DUF58 family) [Kibdelosporangium banguiense]
MITRTGSWVGAAAIVLVATGVWADYPELVTLGLSCAAALLTAVMWMATRPRLAATREIRPQRVTETEVACGVLVVKNEGYHRSPPFVVTENIANRSVAVPVPSLTARSAFKTVYPLPATRRGRYVVPALMISHSDPLQLLRTERSHGGETVLYVHPRIHDVAPMPMGGRRDLEGPTSNNSPPEGVAFHSLRMYEAGDDRRHIHWKSSARTGTLIVRQTVVPDEARHLIILDTSAEPYGEDSFEGAVRAAASLCVAANRAGFPVDLRTTADPATGTEQAERPQDSSVTTLLDLLATTRSSATDHGLAAMSDLVGDVVSADEEVVLGVVTGTPDPDQLEVLISVRPRFLTVVLVQIGHREPGQQITLPGIITVNARTSTEFAVRWNQLALP